LSCDYAEGNIQITREISYMKENLQKNAIVSYFFALT
jgi:hypothetical protein